LGPIVNNGGGDRSIKNALSKFFIIVEVHALVAVFCDGGELVSCQLLGGFDRAMEGGLIGFGIPPVLDTACPSGSNLVVILVVSRKADVLWPVC
jgi:hypothetical protein